jgi:hypothetical protein
VIDDQLILKIRSVTTFSQLKKFLTTDLGWPLGDFEIEELTFDYDPIELGLDSRHAAKIKSIKRLRSLSVDQPWGVFFVEFEKKHLPTAVLRRILGNVAVKKRSNKQAADQVAWAADDLMFISNFGSEGDRRISFAHFSAPDGPNLLPVLRVVSWDQSDAILHLDMVYRELTTKLSWPENSETLEEWKIRWRSAFVIRNKEVIQSSQKLAEALASLAVAIRGRILAVLKAETSDGLLSRLRDQFKLTLIHDLDDDDFADMYAQTVSYGLLSSRITNRTSNGVGDLLGKIKTSPFLAELMQLFISAGGRKTREGLNIDFDELGVHEIVDLLDTINLDLILRNFGDSNPNEDPIIHFYETFLYKYDPEKRMQRGVFYTPTPAVSYIVREVDRHLRQDFGLEDGLADVSTWAQVLSRNPSLELPDGIPPGAPFVKILDPATGTGTFLVEVINLIYESMRIKWRLAGLSNSEIDVNWNVYVNEHLIERLFGFEILMAPYSIAHLKIGLKLYETGYQFLETTRVNIFLTNSLELEKVDESRFEFAIPTLAQEVKDVMQIKSHAVFTVVLGNPPYSTISQNRGEWITTLLEDYKREESGQMKERGNRNQLQDDYVKFIRLAQESLKWGGTIGFITNSSYLRGPWFRGMRYQLIQNFQSVDITDLHGSHAHSLGDQTNDQNIFEITTAVAVMVASRTRSTGIPRVSYASLRGSRDHKLKELSRTFFSNLETSELEPTQENMWSFLPHESVGGGEWSRWTPVPELFKSWGAGVLTNRNGLAVDIERRELLNKIKKFADLSIPSEELEKEYGFGSNYQWETQKVRGQFAKTPFTDLSKRYLFRPFDFRWIYWHPKIVYNMRGEKMNAFLVEHPLPALMFSRNTKHQYYSNVFATTQIPDRHCLEEANVAPLFLPSEEGGLFDELISNLSDKAEAIAAAGCVELNSDDRVTAHRAFLGYVYAILWSETYRQRYIGQLRIDFPRIPNKPSAELFGKLSKVGIDLISLHTMESIDDQLTSALAVGSGDPEISKISWSENTVSVQTAKLEKLGSSRRIENVDSSVWEFHIGGYRVCEKWLKDRKGIKFDQELASELLKIITIIEATQRLVLSIETVIDNGGGWHNL